jgi:predicted N-acetyltransferase YhbS
MVEIKKANRGDFKKIAEIYSSSFSEEPYLEPWTNKKALKKIKLLSKYCEIWKALDKKEIVGFIAINPNQFYPGRVAFGEEMAVKENFRNKGIGSDILKEIFKIYSDRGFEIFNGISNKKSKAFKLYKRLEILESKDNILIERKLK